MGKVSNIGISVFFPCFNDENSIGKLVDLANSTLSKITSNFEVLVINDGSTDSSSQVLKKLQKRFKKLKVITHAKNRGYGGALKTGFKYARKELIFYTDGDGQYDVREIINLIPLMTSDVDFVNGIKMTRHDPEYRVIVGNIYKFIIRWLFWLPIYDADCDFRLIRRSIIKKIDLKSTSGAICIELVKKSQKSGATFRQVSVHHHSRLFGRSQFFKPRKILLTLKDLASLWLDLFVFMN